MVIIDDACLISNELSIFVTNFGKPHFINGKVLVTVPQIGKKLRLFVAVADDDVKRVFINPQIAEYHRFAHLGNRVP